MSLSLLNPVLFLIDVKKTILVLFLALGFSLSAEHQPLHRDHRPTLAIEYPIQPRDRATIHPNGDYDTTDIPSRNWSGYVSAKNFTGAAPNDTVTHVAGSWVVPTLSATSTNAYCAIWVGIDGFMNGTVEQIGTSHNWIGHSQQNYAWFEMYPAGSYEIVGFPVNPGDVISAQVTYVSGTTFQLEIINTTRSASFIVPSSYTKSSSALRSSAEWIVEAPYSAGVLPLSDFHVATLSNCTATISGITGAINSTHWKNEEISMVNSANQAEASPSALAGSGESFEVTWVR